MRLFSILTATFLLAATLVGGCASPRPYVSVLGASHASITEAQSLVVVVEIHNPTGTPLRLSGLEYTLAQADGRRRQQSGRVRLTQTVQPGASITVDISVPVRGGDAASIYDLRGKLSGYAGDVELDWNISAAAKVRQ